MPHCPQCNRRYKTVAKVKRHLNQPRSSCANLIDDLVSVPLSPLDISQYQDTPPENGVDDVDLDMDLLDDGNEFPTQDDMDIDHDLGVATDDSSLLNNVTGSLYREDFADAAHEWGRGKTFMARFDEDQFVQQRQVNLYYPFASKDDWEMASFLLRSGMSMALIDDFLNLQLVSTFLREVVI